jgi:segregation and condensation protein B
MASADAVAPLRALLESLLCASGEPLTLEKAAEVIGNVTRAQVKRAVEALQAEYERDGRGFRIVEVAGGYQLRTAPQNREYVRRLLRERPMRLTRPMLETLAIVAYKQPVTRPEIEAIRGVDVDSVLATLLDRGLIRIAGRKEAPGRPLIYATSREFLEVFSLRHLSDLPTLKELDELEILSAPQIEFAAGAPTGAAAAVGTRGDAVTEMPLPPGRAEPEVQSEGSLGSEGRRSDGRSEHVRRAGRWRGQ